MTRCQVSPLLEQVEKSLENYISSTLESFEAGSQSFKQVVSQVNSVLTEPSLRLQLASICTLGGDGTWYDGSVSKSSKKIVPLLSRWLAISNASAKFQPSDSTLPGDTRSRSQASSLESIETGKLCVASVMAKLWVYVIQNLIRMKAEGLVSLAPGSPNLKGSVAMTRSELQAELATQLRPQLVGHLELLARATANSIHRIVEAMEFEMGENNVIQNNLKSSVMLSAISLAELLSQLCLLVLKLPTTGETSDAKSKEPVSTLRKGFSQFVGSLCDVIKISFKLNESRKAVPLLKRLSAILTSPLLSVGLLKTFFARVTETYWELCLSCPDAETRQMCRLVLARLAMSCKVVPSGVTNCASSGWDQLSKKAIRQSLEVLELLSDTSSLAEVTVASYRLEYLMDLLRDFIHFFGGSGATEGLGHISLGPAVISGFVPLDEILTVVERVVSLVKLSLEKLVQNKLALFKSIDGQAGNELKSPPQSRQSSHTDTMIKSIPTTDDLVSSAEIFLSVEPLLASAVVLLQSTCEMIPAGYLLSRSRNFYWIVSKLFSLSKVKDNATEVDVLCSLIASIRHHSSLRLIFSIIQSYVPTFLIKEDHLNGIAKFSVDTIQFVSGPLLTKDTKNLKMRCHIFTNLARLSPARVLDVVAFSNTKSFPSSPDFSSGIISHLDILTNLLNVSSRNINLELLVAINESTIRLIWLSGHPAIKITASNFRYHSLEAIEALLKLLEASSLFSVSVSIPESLKAAISVLENLFYQFSTSSRIYTPLGRDGNCLAQVKEKVCILLRRLKCRLGGVSSTTSAQLSSTLGQCNQLTTYANLYSTQLDRLQEVVVSNQLQNDTKNSEKGMGDVLNFSVSKVKSVALDREHPLRSEEGDSLRSVVSQIPLSIKKDPEALKELAIAIGLPAADLFYALRAEQCGETSRMTSTAASSAITSLAVASSAESDYTERDEGDESMNSNSDESRDAELDETEIEDPVRPDNYEPILLPHHSPSYAEAYTAPHCLEESSKPSNSTSNENSELGSSDYVVMSSAFSSAVSSVIHSPLCRSQGIECIDMLATTQKKIGSRSSSSLLDSVNKEKTDGETGVIRETLYEDSFQNQNPSSHPCAVGSTSSKIDSDSNNLRQRDFTVLTTLSTSATESASEAKSSLVESPIHAMVTRAIETPGNDAKAAASLVEVTSLSFPKVPELKSSDTSQMTDTVVRKLQQLVCEREEPVTGPNCADEVDEQAFKQQSGVLKPFMMVDSTEASSIEADAGKGPAVIAVEHCRTETQIEPVPKKSTATFIEEEDILNKNTNSTPDQDSGNDSLSVATESSTPDPEKPIKVTSRECESQDVLNIANISDPIEKTLDQIWATLDE